MSRHLAIFVFPDFGHVNPTLEPVRELLARGHRVTYVVDERYAPLVSGTGAQAVTYRSGRARLGNVQTVGVDDMGTVGYDFLVETMNIVMPLAKSAFVDDLPDVVLYDFECFAVARMFAAQCGRPTVQLFPYLASNDVFSPRLEMFDPYHPSIQLGRAALEAFLEANGTDPATVGSFAAESDERNLVFLPRQFQTRGDTFDERFVFVGPSISRPVDPSAEPGAEPWRPPCQGKPVLLASLGTESNGRPEFFSTFAEAFQDDGWHVVMTLGRGSDPARVTSGMPNLEAHEWLPHPAVLPHAKAFVCHGGMGSMLEALYFGTPVVIVPHTPEHLINGRRLSELGLGRVLHGDDLTAQSLRATVDAVADCPETRERVDAMRGHAQAAGGPRRAADVLEGWLRELV